jgi:hypothetical protein
MIKWSFPMNYREAFVNANECGQSYPPATGIYKRLSARLGIALPSLPPLPANPDQEAAQAGACLALALQLMGLYDDLTGSELSDTNGDGFPEITDAYGHPVRYLRYGHMTTYVNGSVAVTPALTANMIARATLGFPTQNGVGGSTSFDCDDPDRLLSDAWYGAPGVSATFMTVFGHPLTPARIYAPMVIISAGRDGGFIAHPITGAAALDDNMDSYRLRIGLTGQ